MADPAGEILKDPSQQSLNTKPNGVVGDETETVVQELFMAPVHQNSVTEQAKACLCSITFLALFTTVCCNLVLGIPAMILSMLAHSSSDIDTSRLYSKISVTLSLIGIVSGIVLYTSLAVYLNTR